jgi:cytochrome P450
MILPFFNSMHDPEVFPSPETLNPNRLLSSANLNQYWYIGVEYSALDGECADGYGV